MHKFRPQEAVFYRLLLCRGSGHWLVQFRFGSHTENAKESHREAHNRLVGGSSPPRPNKPRLRVACTNW
jgi:hypothetical protein